ncbi:P4HA1-like protein [Mya arenaria]|uniref:P4HA1-like protein n=1 Tax=Mya arenaria TaxID=6604 RepID=A0ABY7E7M3_MYAAR|nr:prolyl 4-hydroxylase subunit alpha-1-like [Mya arenaria]WAR05204.1 P4HA1-like protein [Mya arenaria]
MTPFTKSGFLIIQILFIGLFISASICVDLIHNPERLQDALDHVITASVLEDLDTYVHEQERWLAVAGAIVRTTNETMTYTDVVRVNYPEVALRYLSTLADTIPSLVSKMTSLSKNEFKEDAFYKFTNYLPGQSDLSDSIKGIIRLADVYHLSEVDIAAGSIYGRKSCPLTPEECLDIAYTFADFVTENKDVGDWIDIATNWLNFVAKMYDGKGQANEANSLRTRLIRMIRHIYKRSNCECSKQDLRADRMWQNDFPNIPLPPREKDCSLVVPYSCKSQLGSMTLYRKAYNQFCRGEDITKLDPTEFVDPPTKGRYCRLFHNNDPRLILMPAKLEELNTDDPYVALFHDILSDSEMELLKDLGRPRLERAHIAEGNQRQSSDKRIGETGYLKDDEHSIPEVAKIRQRFEAITGLNVNLRAAENFRLTNYAASGYFYLHMDFRENNTLTQNNRLATLLLYFNDVDGGETVFPFINLKVQARRGTGVLFYNLYRSGKANMKSVHGSCPIITGYKWLLTQWISRYHQEFKYPCSTLPNE